MEANKEAVTSERDLQFTGFFRTRYCLCVSALLCYDLIENHIWRQKWVAIIGRKTTWTGENMLKKKSTSIYLYDSTRF